MTTVKIDASEILNWESFHSYFSKLFGFPDFYGKNMNAWIACMTYIDDPSSGMTTNINVNAAELVLEIDNVNTLIKENPGIYNALIECTSFVNYRRIESGELPVFIISFFKRNLG